MVQVEPSPFGLSLRRYRLAAGLTQEELAERAGLSAHAISDLERGARRSPYRDTIQHLANALELTGEERRTLEAAARRVREPAHPTSPSSPSSPSPPTAPRSTLPTMPTSFIEREQEVASVCDLLQHKNTRLLTLTGTGGTGKTRLAIEVGSNLLPQFSDGAFFVSLASISDPGLVLSAIATALDVQDTGGRDLLQGVTDSLRDKQLLILDNFEHLLEAAPIVTQLLEGTMQLRILVTSRAPLHLYGEQEFPVPPLAVPEPDHLPSVEIVSQSEAILLFVERARAVKLSFVLTDENVGAVTEICHRLDGLPLSIELAAARIKLFSPQALLSRLSSRLTLLTGGARDLPSRQQSLRATIDWSYDLLSEGEQRLFARLSVFAGGCTLEAAEAVCNTEGDLDIDVLDGIAGLVDKGLLQQKGEEEPRFVMLETIREYASERLDAMGEGVALQRHHAAYYLELVEGSTPDEISLRQVRWLDRLEEEQDNLRAALQWSLQGGEVEIGLRLAAALRPFWKGRGLIREGRRWLRDLLALPAAGPALLRGAAIRAAAGLAWDQGDLKEARRLAQEQLELCRVLDDKSGMADALTVLGEVVANQGSRDDGLEYFQEGLGLARQIENRQLMAGCLSGVIWITLYWMTDCSRAKPLVEEALALYRELGDRRGVVWALDALSCTARMEGDVDRAQGLFREGLTVLRQLSADIDIRPLLTGYVMRARSWGDYAEARALAEEHLDRSLALRDARGRAVAYGLLALLAQEQGDYERTEHLQEEGLAICRELEDLDGIALALLGLSDVARAKGNPERIIACCTESLALLQQLGRRLAFVAFALHNLGLASWYQGDYHGAEEKILEAISCEHQRSVSPAAEYVTSLGLVMLDQGRYNQARDLFAESLRKHEYAGHVATKAISLEGLAGVALGQGQAARAAMLFGAADALRTRHGTPIWPAVRPRHERHVEAVRAALGEEAFQTAWERGQAMTLEQAVAYALEAVTMP